MKKLTQNPMYGYLLVLTLCSAVGLQGWRTLFDNFAVQGIGLNGQHIGILQSIREIPGFLTFLVAYVLIVIKEHRLSVISVTVLGIGVLITGYFPTFYGLIVTTFIMSMGFHYFETTNKSLTLQYFNKKEAPLVMGFMRSYASLANIAIGVVVYIISSFFDFKGMYVIIGCFVLMGAFWAFLQNPEDKNIPIQHKKMIFRKKYSLFYFLNLMAGARRQIFMAFAVFLLVKKFGFSIKDVTILFFINNLINFFINPMIGKWINQFGERKVLSAEYFSLIFIFMAYAWTDSRWVAGFLYILDHIFFNFAMAINTYFQKIADAEDIAPSMAVSFAINHIAAVLFPTIGGLLWLIDYRIPFLCGAVFSLISLIAVQGIKIKA